MKKGLHFTRWSDLQPLPQFLRSALYNEVYRPGGNRDCCILFLRDRPDRLEFIEVGLHKQIADAHRDTRFDFAPRAAGLSFCSIPARRSRR
jgi:hypothetical protein